MSVPVFASVFVSQCVQMGTGDVAKACAHRQCLPRHTHLMDALSIQVLPYSTPS